MSCLRRFAWLIGTFCLLLAGWGCPPAYSMPSFSPDVLIDVGHGGIDGGTFHEQLVEKEINLQVALRLEKALRAYRLRTAMNRNTDMAPSDDNHWLRSRSRHLRDLAQRKLLMEVLSPRVVVSLHCNWSPSTSKQGPVVLYQFNQQSFILAHLIQGSLNSLYRSPHPPMHGKPFYILNHSPHPTVIVEMGFLSSPADRDMLTDRKNQQKIAEAIASAVWQYLYLFDVR